MPSNLPPFSPVSQPFSRSYTLTLSSSFELKIATQPPAKTVYQRILKPFPSVVLAPKGTQRPATRTLDICACVVAPPMGVATF